MIQKNFSITIYHDKRRAKKDGRYPVKLRVFTTEPRIQKLYPLGIDYSSQEFHSIWEITRPRKEFKDDRLKLQAIEAKANEAAGKLLVFSFEDFERSFIRPTGSSVNDIVWYYQRAIEQYKRNKQIGTASNYELSLKSLLQFHQKERISFTIITAQWLKDYERFMIEEKKRSQTTVGIYLRPLRAVFNTAIHSKDISQDIYPFGKRKYNIPAPRSIKKALNRDQLKLLFESTPKTAEQKKAKDFWFFSYMCNGMNFKDIAKLKYKDITNDTLVFRRAKTLNTNKTNSPVIVYLNDVSMSFIEKYGTGSKKSDDHIFPIIDPTSSVVVQRKKVQNFIRYVNQHFRNFALSIGIEEKISTYWARHSFATNAIRSGASMEFVSEALSHSDLKTTQNYFAGFENDEKRNISRKLMSFE